MATKDNCLFLKDKFPRNNYSHIYDNGDQYLNLNLNQNQKYSNFSPIQSNSKLNNDKFCATFKVSDSTIFDNREDKRNLQTWNKSSDSRFITLNDKTEGVKKNWKKNDSLNFKNNSTFSLHISAYENSTEATVFDDSFNENDKKVLIKEKSSFGSTFVIQNPFEFPRQQNDNVSEPEMSQFRASQRLLNPNEASNNDQQMINRSLPQSYTEFRNRNRESTSMSHFNDFVPEFQPKRIKIDETLNVQPRKSCMKPSASLPSHSSSYNTRTIEDDEELMDSEDEEEYESRGYDVYDDEEEERSSRSRSIDVEEEKVYEDKYEHDEEKYEPQVIQKLLAAQPAKSILKPAAENESNIYYISTSESRGTSKSLSDSEPEQPERSINKARVDEKFVVRENGRIVADFTAIFTPPENLSDEQLEAMEKRRKELGVLFPPFTGTRQDANARYKNIKKIADENGKMYWDGSASQKATISFSATRKRVNKDKIRQIYSRANYESSLKKQQPKKK